MKYRGILLIALMMLAPYAHAGGARPTGNAVPAEKQAGNVKVVMYMTDW